MANEFVARNGIISKDNSLIIGALTATTLIKSGGTSTQFLMADGSVSNGSSAVITGGTVTGATVFTNGLTADTINVGVISATTYLNIPFWTSGTGTNAIVSKGGGNFATGTNALAEGQGNQSQGQASHAEGLSTIAAGTAAHAEGFNTTTNNQYTHAEGQGTSATGDTSHAQGKNTIAGGQFSHAGGSGSTALGANSFVHGLGSFANHTSSIVLGDNITSTQANTTYVENLNIKNIGTGTSLFTLGRDANGFIVSASTSATFTGGTVSGATNFTGGLSANTISANTISANTISATTYLGLPIDIYVTGGTFSANTLASGGTTTFRNTTGGTFVVSGQAIPNLYYAEYSGAPTTLPTATGVGSIAIGDGARASSSLSVSLGNSAGVSLSTTNAQSINIGQLAGGNGITSNSSQSIWIGTSAGYNTNNSPNSLFIGQKAGLGNSNTSNSIMLGGFAGDGDSFSSGSFTIIAPNSIYIGNSAGRATSTNFSGSNNIVIGNNISVPSGSTNTLNLGGIFFADGLYSTGGNTNANPQLLGRVGINTYPTGLNALTVSGDTLISGGLTASTRIVMGPIGNGGFNANGITMWGNGSLNYGGNVNNPALITLVANSNGDNTIAGIQGGDINYGNVRAGMYFQGEIGNAGRQAVIFRVGNNLEERMRISQTGNVTFTITGVGTSLLVNGNVKITTGLTATIISATTYLNLPPATADFSGGTVTGATYFSNGLSANTISATTYLGLPPEVFVTGGTFSSSSSTIIFTNNTGGTFNVTGISSSSSFSGGTVSGATYFSNGLSANTISATTYLGLPQDVFVTSGTFNSSSGSATFTNTTGGTFSVSGFATGQTYWDLSGASNNIVNNNSSGNVIVKGNNSFTGSALTVLNTTGGTIMTANNGGGVTIVSTGNTALANLVTLTDNSGSSNRSLFIDRIATSGAGIALRNTVSTFFQIDGNILSQFSGRFELKAETPLVHGNNATQFFSKQFATGFLYNFLANSDGTNNFGSVTVPIYTINADWVNPINKGFNTFVPFSATVFYSGSTAATYNIVSITPTLNITTGSTLVRGLYINPNLISVTGTNEFKAIEVTTGKTILDTLFAKSISATTISATTYLNLPSFTSTFTGGTITGATFFSNGLSANTISATTYLGLPQDVFVTGGTLINSGATVIFTNNTGGTFNVTGFTSSGSGLGYYLTSGTTNTLPKFLSGTTVANSRFTDTGLVGEYIGNSAGFFGLKFGDLGGNQVVNMSRNGNESIVVTLGASPSQANQITSNNTNSLSLETKGAISLKIGSGFTEGLRVNQFGNTGIGSTGQTAGNARLEVSGNTNMIGKLNTSDLATINMTSVSSFGLLVQQNSSSSMTVLGGGNIKTIGQTQLGSVTVSDAIDSGTTLEIKTLGGRPKLYSGKNSSGFETSFIDSTGGFSGTSFTGTSFIKLGGTSVQFLMADGSVSTAGSFAFNGGTVTGATKFTGGVTANTISAATYLGLPPEVFVTGGTFSSGTATYTNNTGGTFVVTGFTSGSSGVSTATTININGVTQNLSTNREWLTAQGSTGVLTYAGAFTSSTTTINVGAIKGYVVDNETNPLIPTFTFLDFTGQTGVTVTTIGSGVGSYVLLRPNNTLLFQNTFPTSQQRKENILLSKVGHPDGVVTFVINEPDFILSPVAQLRDLFKPIKYINDGISAYPNGNNLLFNITGGFIFGNGVNFVADDENPNQVAIGPITTGTSFVYRTQTGGTTSFVTNVDPTKYDVGGVITSVPSTATTIQWIFDVPSAGFAVQFGQTLYPTLNDAIIAIGKETFTVFPNLVENALLIGVLAVVSTATTLTATTQARFFRADKFGQIVGSQAGVGITTLQGAYDNSPQPQFVISPANGALQVKGFNNTSSILQGLNISNGITFSLDGDGDLTANTISATSITSITGRFTTGLTASTISATTYQNLPIDIRVTGGTHNNGVSTFTNNTGSSFNVFGYSNHITGGTVTASTRFIAGITANTFSATSIGAVNISATSISATTYLNLPNISFTGGTVSGATIFTNGLTANTISATTYLNLPIDVFSGGTVSGATRFTAGLTANTISATTYLNTPYWISGTSGSFSMKAKNDTAINATGNYAVAEGDSTTAGGAAAHAEGKSTNAGGAAAHAEGNLTQAGGNHSHAEGNGSLAVNDGAHAEGQQTFAGSLYSHTEGFQTSAMTFGNYAHAEGYRTRALSPAAHAEGESTTAEGQNSHAEGINTLAHGIQSHAEGLGCIASGESSHAEGDTSYAFGNVSHAEGNSESRGDYSHAEGLGTDSIGQASHSEGRQTAAIGDYSHVGGSASTVSSLAGFVHGIGSSAGTGNTIIVLGSSIIGNQANTTYVDNFNIKTLGLGTSINNLGIDANGFVVVGGSNSSTGGTITGATFFSNGLSANTISATTYLNLPFWSAGTGTNSVVQKGAASGASGNFSVAEGDRCGTGVGAVGAHAEGQLSQALQQAAHAEGLQTTAGGIATHTEGFQTLANQNYAHAEGEVTRSGGQASHAEGSRTNASNSQSHAEGSGTTASGVQSHSEGLGTIASGNTSHAEGNLTIAGGQFSHAEGDRSEARGSNSHAEGTLAIASGSSAHAEGSQTQAGTQAHAEGSLTRAVGFGAHAEGTSTQAITTNAHAEGSGTIANGSAAHAEGANTQAIGANSHAEGTGTLATQSAAHSEGQSTIASGFYSHAEGENTRATGDRSHAEGSATSASTNASHSEGSATTASGVASHAGGVNSVTLGTASFVHGSGSTASADNTIVFGANITGTSANTTYVDNLNIKTVPAGTSINNLGIDINGFVVVGSSGSSISYWSASSGTNAIVMINGNNLANGNNSLAEGSGTTTVRDGSHAEGSGTTASGTASHAEGFLTIAGGSASHAEGNGCVANGGTAHAEGFQTFATGNQSHAEGAATTGTGVGSHAEGVQTLASNQGNHAEGNATVASGTFGAHAEGNGSIASGQTSHAEGNSIAGGSFSHSEGNGTQALGAQSHAEGSNTRATQTNTHAEGSATSATTTNAHAEGLNTLASGTGGAHAEGSSTKAIGSTGSHAEGSNTQATGQTSHSEGVNTIAGGAFSHAEGNGTITLGNASHAEGTQTSATSTNAHSEGSGSRATGVASHAEGSSTLASQDSAHAEGNGSQATNTSSHAEGYQSIASGDGAHAEGGSFTLGEGGGDARGQGSHAEGIGTIAIGDFSHAEGYQTTAQTTSSHSEGIQTKALGLYSHAEGQNTTAQTTSSHSEGTNTLAFGIVSHAEGSGTTASGTATHAEGSFTVASGTASHAEGILTRSFGIASHVGGSGSTSFNDFSFAHGENLIASGQTSFVIGKGNRTTGPAQFSFAGGVSSQARSANSFVFGNQCFTDGQYSFALGLQCTAGGNNSFSHGEFASTSGNFAQAFGDTCAGSGDYSFAHGNGAQAIRLGEYARSSFGPGSGGFGQYGTLDYAGVTTGAVRTELFLGNVSSVANRLFIGANQTFRYEFKAVVRRGSNGDAKEITGVGLINNISGTTAIIGIPTSASTFGSAGLATAAVTTTADNTSDFLKVEVTGVVGATLNWYIKLDYVRVES